MESRYVIRVWDKDNRIWRIQVQELSDAIFTSLNTAKEEVRSLSHDWGTPKSEFSIVEVKTVDELKKAIDIHGYSDNELKEAARWKDDTGHQGIGT